MERVSAAGLSSGRDDRLISERHRCHPLFKGLPEDMCQSPHWGYILKGRVRVKRATGDEVLRAGDVYYLEPGDVPVFEEDTEVLEFSPKVEYQKTIEVAARNIAEMQRED
jgi:hypothetical protein